MRSRIGRVADRFAWYGVLIRDVLIPELVSALHRLITLWKVHQHARR